MGLLSSTHSTLLNDCYPKLTKPPTPIELLQPDSNNTSKLCFYCLKSKKIGPVVKELLERILKGINKGKKEEGEVVVGLSIFREMVLELRIELNCFVLMGLRAVEGTLKAGSEVTVRSTSLFAAISTMISNSGSGLEEEVENLYMKVLEMIMTISISSSSESRMIGVCGLESVINSEIFYNGINFGKSVSIIMDGLLSNCFDGDIRELSTAVSKFTPSTILPLSQRKSTKISSPPKPFDTLLLLQHSVQSLATLFNLANSTQLISILNSIVNWLDRVTNGKGWNRNSWIEWLSLFSLNWCKIGYKARVIEFWSELLTGASDESCVEGGKYLQIIKILSVALKNSPEEITGLGVKNILSHLISTLISRIHLGTSDLLSPAILELMGDLSCRGEVGEMIIDLMEAMVKIRFGSFHGTDSEAVFGLRELVRGVSNVLEESSKIKPKRIKIEGVAIQDSLFLVTEVDSTLRREYHSLLYNFIQNELEFQIVTKNGPIIVMEDSFLTRLNGAMYDLITCPSLGLLPNSSSAMARSTSTRSKSSRKSNGYTAPIHAISTAMDFSKMSELINLLTSQKAFQIVLSVVPMLLALDREIGLEWNEKNSKGELKERIQAGKEIIARGITNLGQIWSILGLERIGKESLAKLTPSVLPSNPILKSSTPFNKAADFCDSLSNLDSNAVITVLSTSKELQLNSGLSESQLKENLGVEWSIETIRNRSSPIIQMSYRALGSKSVTTLSRTRIPSSAFSNQSNSTSVSDLRLASGEISSSNSLASFSGSVGGNSSRRRSSPKTTVRGLLASLGH